MNASALISVLAGLLLGIIGMSLLYQYQLEKAYLEAGYRPVMVPTMYREVWAKDGIITLK
jgi:hypothetical protein